MSTLNLRNDSCEIILGIRGRQFDAPINDGDAAWLVVELSLRVGAKHFMRADPCLETQDLVPLAEWLMQGAEHSGTFEAWRGPPLTTRTSFTEPCLEFEICSGRKATLRVYLSHEFLPPFARELPHTSRGEGREPSPCQAWIDVPVGRSGLLEASAVISAWAHRWTALR